MGKISRHSVICWLIIILVVCLVYGDLPGILIGSFIVIVGVFFIGGGVTSRFLWIRTAGHITHLGEEIKTSDGSAQRVEFEYSVADDVFSGSFEANADCYKLDQKIQLYYNEKDPAKHRTKNWVGDLVVGCLAIIVGVSIIHYDIGN